MSEDAKPGRWLDLSWPIIQDALLMLVVGVGYWMWLFPEGNTNWHFTLPFIGYAIGCLARLKREGYLIGLIECLVLQFAVGSTSRELLFACSGILLLAGAVQVFVYLTRNRFK